MKNDDIFPNGRFRRPAEDTEGAFIVEDVAGECLSGSIDFKEEVMDDEDWHTLFLDNQISALSRFDCFVFFCLKRTITGQK